MKKIKKILVLAILIFLSWVMIANACSYVVNVNIGSVSVGGLLMNEKTYVSIRELAEKFNVPIKWDSTNKEVIVSTELKQVELSDKTEFKPNGVIPDKETAYKIGKILLEEYMGQQIEYTTEDKVYFLNVEYREKDNVWIISQRFEYTNGLQWTYGDSIYIPTIMINKNTGEVVYINTYSSLSN